MKVIANSDKCSLEVGELKVIGNYDVGFPDVDDL